MQASTIKPGLLVALSTSISGNVSYVKRDLEAEAIGGGARVKWETTRYTNDIAEHEAAIKARGRAVAIVRAQCSIFGQGAGTLVCPQDREAALESAIVEAKRIVSEFNSTAQLSRINFYVMVGRVADSDVEAMRAINAELRGLMDSMASGVKQLNAKAIRDAANKATQLGQMLSPEARGRVNYAIDKARQAARQIVKSGERAAREVDLTVAETIKNQKFAFLDLDEATGELAQPESVAFAIDLEPSEAIESPAIVAASIEMEGE